MNSKAKLLARDTIVFTISNIGSKMIMFFLVPLYTNYLSTEEYGIAELVFTYAQLILPVVTCMIYDAVLRFGSSQKENLSNVAFCGVVTCFGSSLISFALLPLMKSSANIGEWGVYLSVYVSICCFYQLLVNYLKVKNKNIVFATVGVIHTALLGAFNILYIAVWHQGVRGYILSNIFGTVGAGIVALITSHIISDAKRGKWDFSLWKRMMAYSSPLILNNIAWWLMHSSDKIMIERMIDNNTLGLYTAAGKIPSLINVMISIFSQAWGLSSIREVESESDTSFASSVFKYYSFLVFGAATAVLLIIKPFMHIYVGKDFVEAWKFTPLLISSAVFYAIATYFASMYSALKKTLNSMWTTIGCAVLNIIINFIGIQIIGPWGAIVGTVVVLMMLALSRMWNIRKYIKLDIDYKKFTINAVLLLSFAIVVTLDKHTVIASIAACLLFVLNNIDTFKDVIIQGKKILKRK